nr:uncharacterized protein LOC127483847 isoform X4 [Oryctolagus cuniculus]
MHPSRMAQVIPGDSRIPCPPHQPGERHPHPGPGDPRLSLAFLRKESVQERSATWDSFFRSADVGASSGRHGLLHCTPRVGQALLSSQLSEGRRPRGQGSRPRAGRAKDVRWRRRLLTTTRRAPSVCGAPLQGMVSGWLPRRSLDSSVSCPGNKRGKTRGKRLPLPADPAPLKATPQPSRPAPPFWQTNGTRHESRGLLSGEKHRADAGSAAMECLEERQVLGAARQGAWCRLGARQCREGAGTVDPAMGWGSGCAGSRRHRPAVSPDPPPPSSPPSPRSPLPSHPTLSLNGCKVRGRRGGGTLVTTSKSARSRTGLGYGGT